MSELVYFNLSWKCQNIIEHIKNKDNPKTNNYIKTAEEIIVDCLSIDNPKSYIQQFSQNRLYTIDILSPLVTTIFKNQDLPEIISSLKIFAGILDKLKNSRQITKKERANLVYFFNTISIESLNLSNRHSKVQSFEKNKNSFRPILV